MKIHDFSIKRLDVLAHDMPDGRKVVADVKANIAKVLGDHVVRLRASDVVRLLDECYAGAPEQVPGAMKLLEVLLNHLDPKAQNAQEPPTSGTASAAGESTPTAITPANTGEPPPAETVAARAASLLKELSAAPTGTKTRKKGTYVSKLSVGDYAKRPKVLKVGGEGSNAKRVGCEFLHWNPDSSTVRSADNVWGRGSDNPKLYEFDATTGETLAARPLAWPADGPNFYLGARHFNEDGTYVFAAAQNEKESNLYVWDAQTGEQIKNNELPESQAYMAVRRSGSNGPIWLSADASCCVSTHGTGHVFEYTPDQGVVREDRVPAQRFALSRDGSYILAVGKQFSGPTEKDVFGTTKVHLYLRESRGPKYPGQSCGLEEIELQDAEVPSDAPIYGFSENGAFMAVRVGKEVRVWDTRTGVARTVATDWESWLPGATAVSNDGKILADVDANFRVQLYDVDKGTRIGEPICGLDGYYASYVQGLSFSPHGTRLLVRLDENEGKNEHQLIVFGEQDRES